VQKTAEKLEVQWVFLVYAEGVTKVDATTLVKLSIEDSRGANGI
jgi:hypothetical protein